nr:uncharacterized protein K02A2.6-like [Dermacentor andersoni]
MDAVKPPEPLQLSGNLRRNWLLFKQKLELYITVTSSEKRRKEAVKAAILSTTGDDGLDVYNNFVFAEDMLSRAATLAGCAEETEDVDIHAVQVVLSLVSTRTKQRLEEETRTDPYLSSVIEQLSTGAAIQGELKPFTSELAAVDGILLKGSKIVIPKAMRAEILRRMHEGHLGQNKCKARARRLVFWPGLDSDIENLVRTCHVCQKYAYSQPTEPLLLRPTPERPWHRVGIDLFQYAGHSYVVVYDDHSNFPEVERSP